LEVTERAFAKINISLDVTAARDDGFHEVITVMQSVALCDDVTVSVVPGEGSFASGRGLPRDGRNTAVKAADAFFAFTGISGYRAEIALEKRIPVGAGLGGGSADAAAVLRALNTAFQTELSPEFLRILGEAVGSDVPFCVEGGTALARGRGEIITPLAPFPNCEIVIVKPAFSVSTAVLFAAIDRVKVRRHPDTDGLLEAIESGSLHHAVRYLYNVFEDVLPAQHAAEISEIKTKLIDAGALGAIMTGTGSAVFGVFESGGPPSPAMQAADVLKEDYREVFVC
jgi:4-diphosphocytidyl-2-C-methyl-D-erythritol kinase